jgi:hypothetical protein
MEVNGLGILVALICVVWITIYFVIIPFHPLFPLQFPTTRMCQGLTPFMNPEQEETAGSQILIWEIFNVLAGVFVYSSHIRIRRYRATHGNSYFTPNRQNIATLNQTIFYAYVKLFLIDFKLAMIQFVRSYFGTVEYSSISHLSLLIMGVDSVLVPLYWLSSIKKHFPELWYPGDEPYIISTINSQEVEQERSARKKKILPRRPSLQMLPIRVSPNPHSSQSLNKIRINVNNSSELAGSVSIPEEEREIYFLPSHLNSGRQGMGIKAGHYQPTWPDIDI